MFDHIALYWHVHGERIGTSIVGAAMMVMTAMAGVFGSISVALLATGPATNEDGGAASAWLWGGGAVLLLGMVARTGKWLGDRYEQWQDRFDKERVDRIRAEVEKEHAEEKIKMLEVAVEELREQMTGLGDRRRPAVDGGAED